MAELLINDSREEASLMGGVLRLPTISVRPGRPNAAASSFASGIVRGRLTVRGRVRWIRRRASGCRRRRRPSTA